MDRDAVVEAFEEYLMDHMKNGDENDPIKQEMSRLIEIVEKEKKLVIACWCAPQRCHGDIIKKYILEKTQNE